MVESRYLYTDILELQADEVSLCKTWTWSVPQFHLSQSIKHRTSQAYIWNIDNHEPEWLRESPTIEEISASDNILDDQVCINAFSVSMEINKVHDIIAEWPDWVVLVFQFELLRHVSSPIKFIIPKIKSKLVDLTVHWKDYRQAEESTPIRVLHHCEDANHPLALGTQIDQLKSWTHSVWCLCHKMYLY